MAERIVKPQPNGTHQIYCKDCEELITTARNERAVLFAASETARHECKKLSHLKNTIWSVHESEAIT